MLPWFRAPAAGVRSIRSQSENGSVEWLFAGGGVSGDTYFASLYQASGGQCLGCPPPDEPPVLEPVGSISTAAASAFNCPAGCRVRGRERRAPPDLQQLPNFT